MDLTGAVAAVTGLRVFALSGERVAFHALGRRQSALATALVAYGGAALLLWGAAWWTGQAHWIGPAFWAGSIYALSFGSYTASLSRGPVGVVSAFANAPPVLLFLLQPTGGWESWGGVVLFVWGGYLLLGGEPVRLNGAVGLMGIADIFLVVGRILDVHHTHYSPMAYAASLFTAVTLWLGVAAWAYGQAGAVKTLWHQRKGWAVMASVCNGAAYLTLIWLLRHLPPALIEAISSFAAIIATAGGVLLFSESHGRRKLLASAVMTLGTMFLVHDHRGQLG